MQERFRASRYTQKVATQEEMNTSMALYHWERTFNVNGFSYHYCVGQEPNEAFYQLPEIAEKMNAKLEAKAEFMKLAALTDTGSSFEDYLRQIQQTDTLPAVIEPFDFDCLRPTRATMKEIYGLNKGAKTAVDYSCLTSINKLQFMSRVAALDFSGDTRLSYDTLFSD
ncbi:hypothetical protein METBIDRAFT_10080 [Metschnikowia bicuspidata var. bicuspidata NRRL YB-4993]|uniref:Uncharacterized protein n=1 Tax=Metschnikowia bicuspidata var. bicuspidata NRRL YB-4993 TaxID=869754 RepID=A0A1A0HJ51_9ASCO|nr:hypothetical protein METBIDRAFT_10080 [Metschnikowia bicuspidata var. bicuspidata NRRL YB-4993]OBA23868.1 hypothetical protein METBIDRAFT_10080 [Metschnikowia bicuspidata var. bicuspidata NRRL YB-4993]